MDLQQFFYLSYLFDEKCHLQKLPKDVIKLICTIFTVFIFQSAFDRNGILSWLRTNSFPNFDIENIINLGVREGSDIEIEGPYFINDLTNEYHIAQSRSVEILGQEVVGAFCSSALSGRMFFLIDLQLFKLKLTHITMSLNYMPSLYLRSDSLIGPCFWGSNEDPNNNNWELIMNDWNVVDKQIVIRDPIGQADDNDYDAYYEIEDDNNSDEDPFKRLTLEKWQMTWKCTTHKYYRYFKIEQHKDVYSKFQIENEEKNLVHVKCDQAMFQILLSGEGEQIPCF